VTSEAKFQGRLIEEHGEAIAGALVGLWADNVLQTQSVTTTTGAFSLVSATAGQFELRIEKAGYHAVSQQVQLEIGKQSELRVSLVGAGALSGNVRWREERPLSGVAVHAVRKGTVLAVARTLSDGSYRLADLPPGGYDVVAFHPRFGATVNTGFEVDGAEASALISFEEIRAHSAWSFATLLKSIKDIWAYRHLLLNLVRSNLRTRYKESVLGLIWSMLLPLAMIGIYTLVFKVLWAATQMPNYTMFLFCGLMPWLYFSQSLGDACSAISGRGNLLKRVYIPPAILPMAVVLQNLVHFFFMLAVFLVVLRLIPVHFYLPAIFLPVLIILQIILNMGLAFFVSALSTFYHDVTYAINILLSFMMFLSAIFYPAWSVLNRLQASHKPTWLFTVYMLNPVATLATSYRDIFLGRIMKGTLEEFVPVFPHPHWILLLAAEAVIFLVGGYIYFVKSQNRFTDVL
jgi:lipopolysaccharide transport system permease protein